MIDIQHANPKIVGRRGLDGQPKKYNSESDRLDDLWDLHEFDDHLNHIQRTDIRHSVSGVRKWAMSAWLVATVALVLAVLK